MDLQTMADLLFDEESWITPKEAAELMRRTPARVHQLCDNGVLRSRWDRGTKLILREDAEAFAADPPRRGRPPRRDTVHSEPF